MCEILRVLSRAIIILNKPLKSAPLRAQLTRDSAMREAAE